MNDVIQAVRESAMLVDLSIAVWGGVVTDPEGLLKAARSGYMAVRARHYELTLSWSGNPYAVRQEGPRLLPRRLTDRYATELTVLRRAAEQRRDEFLAANPELGDEVRSSFRVYFDFEPIPEGFHGLPKFDTMLSSKRQRQLALAQRQVWERVEAPLRHLIKRLETTEPSARFKAASVEHLKELLVLLPAWNVTGDPALYEIAEDIENLTAGLDLKELRKNPALREDLVGRARRIQDKLASWGLWSEERETKQ